MKHHKTKILFVLKKRGYDKISYGLKVSCQKVADALSLYGIESKIAEVIDGNFIDREVSLYKPSVVFLEAIWAEPKKVKELLKLYPKIKWYVRVHSKVEFLAHEGCSFTWIQEYAKLDTEFKNFKLSFNNLQTVEDMRKSLGIKSAYTPNIYLFNKVRHKPNYGNHLKIASFGALRELKGQINQALASIEFANKNNFTIEFYINVSTKFEKCGENILKNLRNIFKETKHKLVEIPWLNHEDFIKVVKTMDVILQVSYSETFCIVAADGVAQNVPVVGSKEIEFLHPWYQADPSDVNQIAKKLEFAYYASFLRLQRLNERGLEKHNFRAIEEWLKLLKK